MSTTDPAALDQEGAITLPARKLVEIVRELPSNPIRIIASGEQRVSIECGRSKFRLLGLPREEFPAFPAVKFDGGWKTSAKDLQQQFDAFGGDVTKALAAYTAGPGAVQRFGGVPPYSETQHYVRIVQANAAAYRAGSTSTPPATASSAGALPSEI